MLEDPAIARIQSDLADEQLLLGCKEGRWRILSFDYPLLDFAVSAVEPDGSATEYGFRAELTNFPATAPKVQIWDHEQDCLLASARRPQGGARVKSAFKNWGSKTVYRPWDRLTGPHNDNARNKPHLAWHPDRHLVFIFEDIHGLLVSNARAARLLQGA